MKPCDVFSEEIHLLVDRELGEAESAIVEEHLLSCPRCTALATHLVRMSSVLKAWDADANDAEAPELRIRHAVLARVQEQSVRRLRDDRLIRVMHLATAAMIVLGLGLGLLLGITDGSDPVETPAIEISDAAMPLDARGPQAFLFVSADPLEPFKAVDVLVGVPRLTFPEFEALAEAAMPSSELWKQAFPQIPGDGGALIRKSDGLPLLVQRFQRHEEAQDRLGEALVFWNGPSADKRDDKADDPLVTVRALSWLHQKGYLGRWVRASTPTSPTLAPKVGPAAAAAAVDTKVSVADMLSPLPGIDREMRSLQIRPPIIRSHTRKESARGTSAKKLKKADLEHLLDGWALPREPADASGLKSGRKGAARVRFLDPIEASANGQLHFGESGQGDGSVVAIVTDTTQPIFIPAGQFITGGIADRVLTHPVWLPATRGKKPHLVSCRIVQNFELGDAGGQLVLQPEIAGPSIRALLAAGASAKRVRAAAGRILAAIAGKRGTLMGNWSLYSVHRGMHARVMGTLAHAKFSWSDLQGFVVTDAQGRFLGSEIVRPGGHAATELLRRLWVSYSAEAGQRVQAQRVRAEGVRAEGAKVRIRGSFAAPSDGPGPVMRRLAAHRPTFRMPAGIDQHAGARVSSIEVVAAGVALHAVQVAGSPAMVSIISTP